MITVEEQLKNRTISRPDPLLYGLTRLAFSIPRAIYGGIKVNFHFEKKKMRGKQVILLGDHASFNSPFYIVNTYPFVPLNIVTGYHHAFSRGLYKPGLALGVIAKKNFCNDIVSTRQMVQVIQRGGSLCIMPEGVSSFCGCTNPVVPGTANFLKKMGVTVVLCKSYGFYNARPSYKRRDTKGYRQLDYYVLFTKDDLKNKTVDEIENDLAKAIKYDDIKFNSDHKCEYKFDDVNGIENQLFRCPRCGSINKMKVNGRDIICEECNNTIHINEYHETKSLNDSLCPYDNTVSWYKDERKAIRREVKEPDYTYSYDTYLYGIHTDKPHINPFYLAGEGRVTISTKSINYKGTRNGENVDLNFDLSIIPTFKHEKGSNICYYHGEFFEFKPKDPKESTMRLMMIVEELHAHIDPKWKKAIEDAYE